MSNVTRDGDTVTVRCCYEPENDCLVIRPYDDDHFRPVLYGFPILERAALAALAAELHSLAGEPNWKSLAMKFGRIERIRQRRMKWFQDHPEADFLPAYLDRALEEAKAAITDAEWAALEGG